MSNDTTELPTLDIIIPRLDAAIAARLDTIDFPGIWTERQRGVYLKVTHHLHTLRQALSVDDALASSKTAKLEPLKSWLATLESAELSIDSQINDAPDWQLIGDGNKRRRQWQSTTALHAAKRALYQGVEFFSGRPALPAPLAVLLAPPACTSCGRPHDPAWHGPINETRKRVGELTQEIERARASLQRHLGEANALLTGLEGLPSV